MVEVAGVVRGGYSTGGQGRSFTTSISALSPVEVPPPLVNNTSPLLGRQPRRRQ